MARTNPKVELNGVITDVNRITNRFSELSPAQAVLMVTGDNTGVLYFDDGSSMPLSDLITATGVLPFATDIQRGIIQLATQPEVAAGSDTEKAVTPATLVQTFENRIDRQLFGNGIDNIFVLTHPTFISDDIILVVQESSTNQFIQVDWRVIDVNSIEIGPFSFIPTSNQFRANMFSPLSY